MTYKPGDQPDPAFTAFFAGEWQDMLKAVTIPGTDGNVSWDRKAAYLLWYVKTGTMGAVDTLDLIVSRKPPPVGMVNHTDDWPFVPTPGGVSLTFNSGEHKNETKRNR